MGKEILRGVSAQKFNVAFKKLAIKSPTLHQYDVGLSINDVIDDLGIRPAQKYIRALVNGNEVDFFYKPRANDFVEITIIQQGAALGWVLVAAIAGAAVGYFLYKKLSLITTKKAERGGTLYPGQGIDPPPTSHFPLF